MRAADFSPDSITILSLTQSFATGKNSSFLKAVHSWGIRAGVEADISPEEIADQGAEHPTISDDFFRQLKTPLTFDGKKLLKTVSAKCDLRKVLAPSTVGVIVGFAVGLIPQIRKALIGDLAPLQVIQDSASLLSDGAIPSVTVIMGGNLMKGIRR
ncbi:hypothetical protein ACLOJK_017432 [Asimina triloba]